MSHPITLKVPRFDRPGFRWKSEQVDEGHLVIAIQHDGASFGRRGPRIWLSGWEAQICTHNLDDAALLLEACVEVRNVLHAQWLECVADEEIRSTARVIAQADDLLLDSDSGALIVSSRSGHQRSNAARRRQATRTARRLVLRGASLAVAIPIGVANVGVVVADVTADHRGRLNAALHNTASSLAVKRDD